MTLPAGLPAGALRGLVILDRDGVLNRMLWNPVENAPDSPMHPGEVELFPWVPAALRALSDAGFGLAVASNQPAAAKGKTSRGALEEAHARVVMLAQSEGGRILSSHICWHRREDGCACRKPRPGLLEEALQRHEGFERGLSWMVGDRAVDVLAGAAAGLSTALLGEPSAADRELLVRYGVTPSFCGADLRDFGAFLIGRASPFDPETAG